MIPKFVTQIVTLHGWWFHQMRQKTLRSKGQKTALDSLDRFTR